MKFSSLFIANLFICLLLGSVQLNATYQQKSIIGKWYAEDLEQSTISVIKKSDNTFEGHIIASSNADYIGKKVLHDVRYSTDDQAYKGTLHSPKRDITIACTLTLESQHKLKVVGKKFLITKTFYWDKK
ncbi:MAG: DUF2147 domain-containing protein [Flammeovirgaceae bacterium]